MRSGGNVLLTAISMISSGLRPDRLAAAAICSRTRAMFSTIGIGRRTTQDTKYHDGEFCFGWGVIVATERRSVGGRMRPPLRELHHAYWRGGFVGIACA